MIDPRRDLNCVEDAAQTASAPSVSLRSDISCQVTAEYNDYAISTALSSATKSFEDLDPTLQDSILHSYTLTGNVELSDASAYESWNPSYAFTIIDPYGSKSPDPLVVWGDYFTDMLKEIDSDVQRRKGNVITLDFASMMMVVASLSSMITLNQPDLVIIPSDLKKYNDYTGKKEEVSKKAGLLKTDPVLFHWFAVQYLLSADPNKEMVARALYSALRCGLVHSLTVGQDFGSKRGGYVIMLGSRNPDHSSTEWYSQGISSGNHYVFYFKELYAAVDNLVRKLFAIGSTDPSVMRFQSDARTVLAGHIPVKLLKAERKTEF